MFFQSVLTAPLTTSYISLQLSINPMRNQSFSHEILSKIPLNSPDLLRKASLLLENSMKTVNNPVFKAPKFVNYPDVFRGLANQGFLGLYKGNFISIWHIWLGTMTKLKAGFFIEKSFNFSGITKEISIFLMYTIIDMGLHPLQTLQTRLILQNRHKKLALYRNSFEFFKQGFNRKSLFFQGVFLHIPKNFFIISSMGLCQNTIISRNLSQNSQFLISNLLATFLSYPFMTLMRRLMCQDSMPFMLEKRYKGIVDGASKILREEGIKGGFRGFCGCFVVSSFMLALNFTYQETLEF